MLDTLRFPCDQEEHRQLGDVVSNPPLSILGKPGPRGTQGTHPELVLWARQRTRNRAGNKVGSQGVERTESHRSEGRTLLVEGLLSSGEF